MKLQTSVVRGFLLFAPSLLLFAIFQGSAAAQEKPATTKDEATRAKFPAAKSRAPVPTSANGYADSENAKESKADKDSPDAIRKREEWFHKQRASANGHIPSGAHRLALEHMQRMMEKEGKLIRRADGTIQEESSQGLALTTAWSPIGPSPTSGGFFSPVTGRITAIAIDPTDATGNTVLIGGAQGGIWRTADAGTTWTAVGDQNASLAMGSIAFAPSAPATVYAGTGEQASIGLDNYYGAGVLKSTNGGLTWTQTCTTPSAACPFIGPFSDSTPFEFFTFGGARIIYVSVNPSNPQLVLVGAQFGLSGPLEGVYCSADGGGTWSNVLPGQMSTFVGFASSTVAFVALGDPFGSNSSGAGANPNGIYKSTNANSCSMTFSQLTAATLPAANTVGRIDMGISPNFATDSTVYASIAASSTGSNTNLGVWVTTNGGSTWTQTTAPDICQQQCWYDNVVKVDPNGGAHAFFGGSAVAVAGAASWVVRTADTGATWASVIPNLTNGGPTEPHVDNHAMAFVKLANGKVRMYLGNDGGIWRTDDAEATPVVWNDLNDSILSLTQFYPALSVHPSSPNVAFAGAQDNGSQIYAGTNNWTNDGVCGDGTGTAIDNIIPSTVYVTCNGNGIFVSTQNGTANTFLFVTTNGINPADNADFVPPLLTDPSAANTVYTGTTKVYQSVNAGLSWVALSGDLVSGTTGDDLTAMVVAPTNPAVVYAGADSGQVFVATNVAAGVGTFASVAGQASLPPRRVNAIAVDPADATGKTAYAAFSGFAFVVGTVNDPTGHLFKTTDGGATWKDVSCTVANCSTPAVADLPNTPVNDVVVDPNVPGTLYVGTDIGVFQGTCVTTCTWATLSTGLPRVAVLSLKLHAASRTLIATTHGRGAWDLLLSNFTFPGPHISSLSQVSAIAGAAGFTLTVTGNGLMTGGTGTIQFGGTALAPVGTQSDTSLSGTVLAAQVAGGGAPQVTVTVGATTSNALTFTVLGGAPTISSPVTPASEPVNMAATQITVNGTGFTSTSTVLMNPDAGGTPIPTNFVSGTQLIATVPASFMASFGSTNSVGVRNPTPGGGTTLTTQTVTLPTFVVIASAPANDNFASAMPVTPGVGGAFTDTKDSSGATTQSTDPAPPCQSPVPTVVSNTIWYQFTPTSNGTITDVDTIGSSYDTVLSIWTGSAGSLTAVPNGCNDDIVPTVAIQSQIQNVSVTAGTTYYFMVSSFGQGDFNPVAFGGKSVFNLTFASGAANSFSLSASTLSPSTVAAGGTGISTITVTPGAGSTGTQTVSVTCSTTSPGISCAPNPLPISATGTTAATGQLTVTVAMPAAMGASASLMPQEREMYAAGMLPTPRGKGWWMLSAGTGLAGFVLLLLPGRKRYRAAVGLGLICMVSFAIGCGSSSGGGGGGGPVATTTKLTVTSATKLGTGGPFAFTVAVTGGTPTGQVQLLDGGMAIAGATAAVSGGAATFANVALTTVGTHAISASYAGDANTLASASGALNVTVTGSTTVTVKAAPAASNGALTINMTIN
jgi:hypothetical protein